LTACALGDAKVVYPAELTGKWVHRRPDGTWGDTVAYLADGRMVGSQGHVVASAASWAVVRSRVAGEGLCITEAAKPACNPFRLVGDTLVVGTIEHASYFHRAP
jgi:hypothetical protein